MSLEMDFHAELFVSNAIGTARHAWHFNCHSFFAYFVANASIFQLHTNRLKLFVNAHDASRTSIPAHKRNDKIQAKKKNAIENKLKAINIKLIFQWHFFHSLSVCVHCAHYAMCNVHAIRQRHFEYHCMYSASNVSFVTYLNCIFFFFSFSWSDRTPLFMC